MSKLYKFIWDMSELTGVPLGRFAHIIFGKMIGSKGKRQ